MAQVEIGSDQILRGCGPCDHQRAPGFNGFALEARRLLCAAAGSEPPCPDEMIGSLASVILPDGPTTEVFWRRPDPLQRRLYDDWKIEVPIMSWPAPPRRLIRISAQLYNTREDYVRLAQALSKELPTERP